MHFLFDITLWLEAFGFFVRTHTVKVRLLWTAVTPLCCVTLGTYSYLQLSNPDFGPINQIPFTLSNHHFGFSHQDSCLTPTSQSHSLLPPFSLSLQFFPISSHMLGLNHLIRLLVKHSNFKPVRVCFNGICKLISKGCFKQFYLCHCLWTSIRCISEVLRSFKIVHSSIQFFMEFPGNPLKAKYCSRCWDCFMLTSIIKKQCLPKLTTIDRWKYFCLKD